MADCFVLAFRAIARASRFEWVGLECQVEGVLDRVEKTTRFIGYTIKPTLRIPENGNQVKARRLLEKAERNCLITNSLLGEKELICRIETVPEPTPDNGWDEAV